MRIKTALASVFMISTVAAGCFVEEAAPESTEDSSATERGRKKLGKADSDLTGSCKAITHDENSNLVEKSYCGGKSFGTCWCDESCADYGDCCSDIADSCDVEPPPTDNECGAGKMLCDGCCGETLCVDENPLGCPMVLCAKFCPPPTCDQTGGTCMSDPNDVTFPAVCGNLGLSDGIGSCEAFNQTCCGDPLTPPPPPGPTCAGNCGGSADGKACFCDDACSGYGDCCSDYEAICTQ